MTCVFSHKQQWKKEIVNVDEIANIPQSKRAGIGPTENHQSKTSIVVVVPLLTTIHTHKCRTTICEGHDAPFSANSFIGGPQYFRSTSTVARRCGMGVGCNHIPLSGNAWNRNLHSTCTPTARYKTCGDLKTALQTVCPSSLP